MKVPFLTNYLAKRNLIQMKERNEQILKGFVDSRSILNKLPQAPEILPYPQSGAALRSLAFRVPIARTVVENLSTEQFRRLPPLKPKFEAKCPECGAEYQDYIEFCENPMCTIQGIKTRRPDPEQKQLAKDWEQKVNYNGRRQTIHDLAKMFATDAHIQDNPWITVSYEYVTDQLTGEIIAKKPIEFVYARPEVMRLIQDEYGRPGGKYWTCVDHRDILYGPDQRLEPCEHCNKPLHKVTAVSIDINDTGTASIKERIDNAYIDGEWFHDPYYTQTTSYGISNLYTVWTVATTLQYMDELENNTFKLGRPPKSLLLFNSYNPESIKSQLTDEYTRAHKNRNYQPKLVYPFDNKNPAMVLNLMPNDSELDVMNRRKEIKEMIGILYGQSAFMIGDMSTGGGLNNEGMQQTTMLRRVESLNEWIENGFYNFHLKCIGVTDFCYKFPPPKEEDRMAVIQRKKENLLMIGEVLNRGGDYIIKDDEDLEFEIVGKMGKLDSGMGFKEMGGSGYNPRDWQSQDSSFAFSADRIRKFGDTDMNIALLEYLSGETTWDEFIDQFRQLLLRENAWVIREQVNSINPELEINTEVLLRFIDNPYLNESLDQLKIDVQSTDKSLTEIGNMINSRLENILRTESEVLVNNARASAYEIEDPDDDVLDYHWVGPDAGGRSTLVCQAIKREFERCRAEKGRVSLEDARRIVDEEGCKEHGDEKAFCMGRSFMPHYNCRHNLVARSVFGKSQIYVDDPSHAPPNAQLQRGPKGGWYYDGTRDGDVSGDELDEGDGDEPQVSDDSNSTGGGIGETGSNRAIVVQDESDPEVYHLKVYDASEEEAVVEATEESGYQVKEVETIEVREAVGK